MGRVYLGMSTGKNLAAVKVVRPELADDPNFRARFAREIAAARTVSGKYTAAVVDADAQAATPWMATAYVAGPSLAEAIHIYGPLPASSVLALSAGLAQGLAAVHAAGVVHRDLKPANVLLAQDGPRLIDFGISRAAEASSLTRSGVVVGSPGFMSPEQAEGREVGAPSDIFSLAAVIVFAATGLSPFGSGPTPALVYRAVHGDADLSGLDERVRQLAQRCLAKDPAQRPSAEEVMAAAAAAQPADGWLPANIVSVLPKYRPFPPQPAQSPRTNRHLAWAAAGLVLVMVAAAGGVPANPHDESTATQSARTAQTPAGHSVSARSPVAISPTSVSPPPSSLSPDSQPRRTGYSSGSSPPVTSPSTGQGSTPGTGRASTAPTAAAPPTAPESVQASAASQYALTVTWSDSLAEVTGFRVDNGCDAG